MKITVDSEILERLIAIAVHAYALRTSVSRTACMQSLRRMFDAVDAFDAYITAKTKKTKKKQG